jgi:two-component system response regulator HydG
VKSRILIVDDNLEMARMLADEIADHGHHAVPLASGRAAVDALSKEPFDVVVTDLRMPDADGLQVLAASKSAAPARPVIVMTAYSAIDTAVEAIRSGAYHYITKPFKAGELVLFVERALSELAVRDEAQRLRGELRARSTVGALVHESAAMRAVVDVIERVSSSSVPMLLLGETGTGKSIVARAIHDAGPRADKAFVTVNCAALPEQLLESELFGHLKGAFTGAHNARRGLFAEADGGTILLDEIADMASPVQAKLLHVLERGVVRPVGAEREIDVDVRVIAATNRDLRADVASGRFREDLLFRLDVVSLELPPLRARSDDIVALAAHFFDEAKARHPKSPVERLGRDVMDAFLRASWPGNVRELKHVVERLVVLGKGADATLADVPSALVDAKAGAANAISAVFSGDVVAMRKMQRSYAQWAFAALGGNKARTAEKLALDVKTLSKLLADTDGEE